MEMSEERIKKLEDVNLYSVFDLEFRKFSSKFNMDMEEIKQQGVIRKIFSGEIFSIARKWLSVVSKTAASEIVSSVSIKIQGNGTMSAEDIVKLKSLIIDSREINTKIALGKMRNSLKVQKLKYTFNILLFLSMFWMGVKENWHNGFMQVLVQCQNEAFERKLKINTGVINFTNSNIPSRLEDILSKGRKFIPEVEETQFGAIKDFEAQILNQVRYYAWKYEKIRIHKKHENVRKVLDSLISSTMCKKAKTFYKTLNKRLWTSRGLIQGNLKRKENLSGKKKVSSKYSVKTIIQDANKIENCAWNLVDKERGILLINTKVLRDKEIEVMKTLGAKVVNESKEFIFNKVIKEQNTLRSSLTTEQSVFLKPYKKLAKKNLKMPFIKVPAKIHKLSTQEILDKNVDNLRFRPVNDSVFFVSKPESKALCSLLQELNKTVLQQFPSLKNSLPLSGWEFSSSLVNQKIESNEQFNLHYSCDLSDAYTNCQLSDLLPAVKFLYRITEEPIDSYKPELVEKLATFVLSNNYAEAGGELWLCGQVLPMGYACSGEALDSICLAGEVVNFCGIHIKESEPGPLYLKNNKQKS